MIDRNEIRQSLIGAWRVFLGAPDALRFFDTGGDGFWRSFQAILLVAPLYAVTAFADWQAAAIAAVPGGEINGGAFIAARAVTLALDWVTLPILLAGLAGFLGIKPGYPAFIVVRNWSTVLTVLPFTAIAFLDILGLLPGDIVIVPSLVALGFALRVGYMVARRALGVAVEVAIGLVVLDFLVSLAIVRIVEEVFGVAG